MIDLGCGTGLNFAYLRSAVGESGGIIGVDLTPAMLAQARQRARRSGWQNIELVEAEMSVYDFPCQASGVLVMVPDYADIVARDAASRPAGARIANFEGTEFSTPGTSWMAAAANTTPAARCRTALVALCREHGRPRWRRKTQRPPRSVVVFFLVADLRTVGLEQIPLGACTLDILSFTVVDSSVNRVLHEHLRRNLVQQQTACA